MLTYDVSIDASMSPVPSLADPRLAKFQANLGYRVSPVSKINYQHCYSNVGLTPQSQNPSSVLNSHHSRTGHQPSSQTERGRALCGFPAVTAAERGVVRQSGGYLSRLQDLRPPPSACLALGPPSAGTTDAFASLTARAKRAGPGRLCARAQPEAAALGTQCRPASLAGALTPPARYAGAGGLFPVCPHALLTRLRANTAQDALIRTGSGTALPQKANPLPRRSRPPPMAHNPPARGLFPVAGLGALHLSCAGNGPGNAPPSAD
ncbi:uncharacterized protein LOC128109022 [Peromyscus californicus insignis]|uniref:uncharacterized protein LOC128109022 n=1 Tax=Peromyscus californicus insignis TaxID=564181 RepID=UPI0022A662A4|nr:uncharacterized protein LOC128109022 [Peromyscus californicus insignis]